MLLKYSTIDSSTECCKEMEIRHTFKEKKQENKSSWHCKWYKNVHQILMLFDV